MLFYFPLEILLIWQGGPGQAWRKVKNVEKYRKMADCAARMLTKLGGLLYNEIYSDCDVIKTDSDLRSFLAGRYQVME